VAVVADRGPPLNTIRSQRRSAMACMHVTRPGVLALAIRRGLLVAAGFIFVIVPKGSKEDPNCAFRAAIDAVWALQTSSWLEQC
jgi:hypothetical protein